MIHYKILKGNPVVYWNADPNTGQIEYLNRARPKSIMLTEDLIIPFWNRIYDTPNANSSAVRHFAIDDPDYDRVSVTPADLIVVSS